MKVMTKTIQQKMPAASWRHRLTVTVATGTTVQESDCAVLKFVN